MGKGASTEQVVREIHRRTRRRFSAEEKVRIVLEGLRGEESVAELCRREGLAPNLYYRWSKEFLEAGKKRLLGDTTPGGDACTGASLPDGQRFHAVQLAPERQVPVWFRFSRANRRTR